MPHRQNRRFFPVPLDQQGRGGEPSLAVRLKASWDYYTRLREESRGKAEGSFTQAVRSEFHAWMRRNGLDWHSQITFEYKWSRHRIVLVVMDMPYIIHDKLAGDGSKGFLLLGNVLSIDGAQPASWQRRGVFAMTRIQGRFRRELYALRAPEERAS